MSKIPGLSQMPEELEGLDADEEIKRIQGMIDSMTAAERSNPGVDRHLAATADRRGQRRRTVRSVGHGQAVRCDGGLRQADGPDDHVRPDPDLDRAWAGPPLPTPWLGSCLPRWGPGSGSPPRSGRSSRNNARRTSASAVARSGIDPGDRSESARSLDLTRSTRVFHDAPAPAASAFCISRVSCGHTG